MSRALRLFKLLLVAALYVQLSSALRQPARPFEPAGSPQLSRGQVSKLAIPAVLATLATPRIAAAKDCFKDCVKECLQVVPGNEGYCRTECEEFCKDPPPSA
mmetsp:Transcript_17173/g.65551  ORF Transcript_17173/g.65551 Transcript_17173/m.65551 type:complete len:102 (-) Transcript_17173:255-560(-)